MATFHKFDAFVLALAEGKHNLSANTFYVQLLATEPSQADDAVETDLPADLSSGGGYTAGGVSCGTKVSSAQVAGLYKLCIADKVITCVTDNIGPFQYVVLLNNSATNKDLIGYFDYGSAITLHDTETFTIDFSDANGILTLT